MHALTVTDGSETTSICKCQWFPFLLHNDDFYHFRFTCAPFWIRAKYIRILSQSEGAVYWVRYKNVMWVKIIFREMRLEKYWETIIFESIRTSERWRWCACYKQSWFYYFIFIAMVKKAYSLWERSQEVFIQGKNFNYIYFKNAQNYFFKRRIKIC